MARLATPLSSITHPRVPGEAPPTWTTIILGVENAPRRPGVEGGRWWGPSQLYDPSTEQWTFTGPMYFSFAGGTDSTTLLKNGDVLVFGNILPSYASQFHDPIANKWTGTTSNLNGIQVGPLALLNTAKVLLAGGHQKYGGFTRTCFLFDPSINRWSSTGSLIQPGVNTLTPLPNGQVLAVTNTDVELYTP